jgi:alkylation response protein AidB-like acyl-CoA dehydrogenase
MDLQFSEEQLALRDSFARFFATSSPPDVVRAAEPLGYDPTLWARLVELEVPLMGVSEDLGGGGASLLDLVVVVQEFGRRVAPAPLVEGLVASNVLAQAGAGEEVLSAIASGQMLATVALEPVREGVKQLVPAAAVAEAIVALDGTDLVCLRRQHGQRPYAPPLPNLGSSPLADVVVGDSVFERTVLASGAPALALHAHARAQWMLLTAAALDGIRSESLALGVDYVKGRWAFGVPIAWFQAVQHRLADVATTGDGAQLLLYEAAWAGDEPLPEAATLAAMAFLAMAEIAQHTSRESLQFHGGYGYTLEYDIQLYFRRARAWPLALGDPCRELRRVADALFVEPS